MVDHISIPSPTAPLKWREISQDVVSHFESWPLISQNALEIKKNEKLDDNNIRRQDIYCHSDYPVVTIKQQFFGWQQRKHRNAKYLSTCEESPCVIDEMNWINNQQCK